MIGRVCAVTPVFSKLKTNNRKIPFNGKMTIWYFYPIHYYINTSF